LKKNGKQIENQYKNEIEKINDNHYRDLQNLEQQNNDNIQNLRRMFIDQKQNTNIMINDQKSSNIEISQPLFYASNREQHLNEFLQIWKNISKSNK